MPRSNEGRPFLRSHAQFICLVSTQMQLLLMDTKSL